MGGKEEACAARGATRRVAGRALRFWGNTRLSPHSAWIQVGGRRAAAAPCSLRGECRVALSVAEVGIMERGGEGEREGTAIADCLRWMSLDERPSAGRVALLCDSWCE